jgi:small-conductance mechanosensitive channel
MTPAVVAQATPTDSTPTPAPTSTPAPPSTPGAGVGPLPGLPPGLEGAAPLAGQVLGFLAGALLVYAVGRLFVVPGVLRVVRSRNRNNPTLETATETYLELLVLAAAVLAGIVGAGYGGLLTDSSVVLAALTLVVGVAGQEVIGSLISGFFLVADRDFNVGDWIAWPGGEGVVEAVDFRVTRVRTLNNETVVVPNTELTTQSLTRPYGRERYRLTERVTVAYTDDVERALMTLATTAGDDDRVLEDPAPSSRVVELGEATVALETVYWVSDPMDVDLVSIRSDFRRRIMRRLDEVGVTLGPPSTHDLSGELAVDLDGDGPGDRGGIGGGDGDGDEDGTGTGSRSDGGSGEDGRDDERGPGGGRAPGGGASDE